MRFTFHITGWPILTSVVLLAFKGSVIATWNYEVFVGPRHVLWFLGIWLLSVATFMIIVAGGHTLKSVIKWATNHTEIQTNQYLLTHTCSFTANCGSLLGVGTRRI